MKAKKNLFLALVAAVCFSTTVSAQDILPRDTGLSTYHTSPRYRESESHPVRILAYVLHPVGWVLREGIFRPLSAFTSSTEVTRSVFGYREPYDFRDADCFSSGDSVPDCRQLSPMKDINFVTDRAAKTADESGVSATAKADMSSDQQIYFPDVAFDYDRSSLTALGRGRIRQVAQLLATIPSVKIAVSGHTDSHGTDAYNDALGKKRADAVVKELSDLGVDPARLEVLSKGKTQPIFTEATDWADAVNRRVQFQTAASN